MSVKHLLSSSPCVRPWLILLPCFFFFFDDSLPELPVIGLKVRTKNNVCTPETNQTVVQFYPDRDCLFLSDQGLVVWSGLWSKEVWNSCNFGFDQTGQSGPNKLIVKAP